MRSSKTNIKFCYEYRDAGNYKQFNEVIFPAANAVDLVAAEEHLRQHLFDSEFFYPYKLGVPTFEIEKWNSDLDHHWYFFEGLEPTEEAPNDKRTFQEFLKDVEKWAKEY